MMTRQSSTPLSSFLDQLLMFDARRPQRSRIVVISDNAKIPVASPSTSTKIVQIDHQGRSNSFSRWEEGIPQQEEKEPPQRQSWHHHHHHHHPHHHHHHLPHSAPELISDSRWNCCPDDSRWNCCPGSDPKCASPSCPQRRHMPHEHVVLRPVSRGQDGGSHDKLILLLE